MLKDNYISLPGLREISVKDLNGGEDWKVKMRARLNDMKTENERFIGSMPC